MPSRPSGHPALTQQRPRTHRPAAARPPPDLMAEQAALSACVVDERLIPSITAAIHPDGCLREASQRVLVAIVRLDDHGEAVNPITVPHDLDRRGRPDHIGGSAYLS